MENQAQSAILNSEAHSFLSKLSAKFESRRQELLAHRHVTQKRLRRGLASGLSGGDRRNPARGWTVASIPNDLLDRRVEITGPVDRKMIINALNSGANVFMADFEDSNSPTWRQHVRGQHQSARRDPLETIAFTEP